MNAGGRHGPRSAILVALSLVIGACTEQQGGLSALQSPPEVSPAQSETYLKLGNRLLAAREPDLAMKAYLSSMTAEGITADALTGAGIAAQQQGLLTAARRYLQEASLQAPDSVHAHNNLGVVLYQLKEYYPARNAFRTAFALSSGTSEFAARNLNRVEEFIAQIEANQPVDTSISHDVLRLGSSEFRLIDARSSRSDAEAE